MFHRDILNTVLMWIILNKKVVRPDLSSALVDVFVFS